MSKQDNNKSFNKRKRLFIYLISALGLIIFILIFFQAQKDSPKIETKKLNLQDTTAVSQENVSKNNNNHVLAQGEGLEVVKVHCTSCHSARLITQNRATREGWLNMIRWMQQTQNLWDLGENEEIILNYLSTHYAPEEKGRRENLKDIEWYELNE